MDATPIINESFRGLLPSKEEVSGITQYRGTNTRGFIDSRHDLAGGRRLPNEEEATAAASDLARYTLQRENPLNPIYDQLEILRTGETTRSPSDLKAGQPRRYYRKTNPDGSTSYEEIPTPPDTAAGSRRFNDYAVEGDIIEEGGFNELAKQLRDIAGNEDAANIFEGLDDVTRQSFRDIVDPALSEDDLVYNSFIIAPSFTGLTLIKQVSSWSCWRVLPKAKSRT